MISFVIWQRRNRLLLGQHIQWKPLAHEVSFSINIPQVWGIQTVNTFSPLCFAYINVRVIALFPFQQTLRSLMVILGIAWSIARGRIGRHGSHRNSRFVVRCFLQPRLSCKEYSTSHEIINRAIECVQSWSRTATILQIRVGFLGGARGVSDVSAVISVTIDLLSQ